MACSGDDEPVGGVSVEITRQAHSVQRYGRLDWQQTDTLGTECPVHPSADIQRQAQSPLFNQKSDFPRRNRRYSNAVRAPCFLNGRGRLCAETSVALDSPNQDMGVQQDQRWADQSEGIVAGAKGSSYPNTVPRIMPTNGGAFSVVGNGDSTATGRPRLVMVTGRPSLSISLMMRRHLALKSAAETRPVLMHSSKP